MADSKGQPGEAGGDKVLALPLTESENPAETPKSRFGASLIVTTAAALSRILGFARDILIAFIFGGGLIAGALLLALRVPSFVRRLFSEGALNAGFVPLYLAIKNRSGAESASRFAIMALVNTGLLLVAVWGIAHLAAPIMMASLAGWPPGESELVLRATQLSRWAMPVVIGSGLAAMMAAWLNAEGRFALAAFSGLVTNLAMIVVLVVLFWRGDRLDDAAYIFALTWSVAGALHMFMTGAGLMRFASQMPQFDAIGNHSTHQGIRRLWNADQARLALLIGPGLLVSAAPLAMLLVATPGAATLPSGIAWLYYADRIAQLPLGFVGVAASIVLMPDMARRAIAKSDKTDAGSTIIDEAIAAACALVVPASLALVVLAQPIVSALFARGAFTAHDVDGVAAILVALPSGALLQQQDVCLHKTF
jgi:putative peptidoglycan lipid II flippase